MARPQRAEPVCAAHHVGAPQALFRNQDALPHARRTAVSDHRARTAAVSAARPPRSRGGLPGNAATGCRQPTGLKLHHAEHCGHACIQDRSRRRRTDSGICSCRCASCRHCARSDRGFASLAASRSHTNCSTDRSASAARAGVAARSGAAPVRPPAWPCGERFSPAAVAEAPALRLRFAAAASASSAAAALVAASLTSAACGSGGSDNSCAVPLRAATPSYTHVCLEDQSTAEMLAIPMGRTRRLWHWRAAGALAAPPGTPLTPMPAHAQRGVSCFLLRGRHAQGG